MRPSLVTAVYARWLAARLRRARAWLLSHTPRTTEERAYQIFGASLTGSDKTTMDRLAPKLIQRPDGGWASLDGRASDAYSTGEALWALGLAAKSAARSAANNAKGIDRPLAANFRTAVVRTFIEIGQTLRASRQAATGRLRQPKGPQLPVNQAINSASCGCIPGA